ncbi:zinc-binding dehydrogenase [Ornithinimicrobium sp. LYQ121]|uniref:zinc-binding dehydrogenase n=1 Tax=Ornithinimicrobium sp. LYQ121 TaxID=3378801 RepID=UPI0038551FD7
MSADPNPVDPTTTDPNPVDPTTTDPNPTVPPTMRAAVWRGAGRPLTLEELHTPVPQQDEVLVRVTACGVCHSDLHVLDGAIPFPQPAVLGHEISGTITALGPGAERRGLTVGRSVSGAFLMPCGWCTHCVAGRDDLCSEFFGKNRLAGQLFDGTSRLRGLDGETVAMYSMGGLAEYAVLPATSVAPLPPELEMVSAAILGCAGLTAYGAVRRAADVRPGETVAVVAVGGVGSNLVQVAAAFGASQVIAVDIDDEKLAAAGRLGATHTVNSLTTDARQAVLDLTGGRGVDVAFEAVGGPRTFELALQVLAPGGRMVPVGLGAAGETAPVEINLMVRRSLRIIANYGARTRTDLPAVIELAASGALRYRDVVTRTYGFEEVDEAYGALRAGTITGRAVVTIGEMSQG